MWNPITSTDNIAATAVVTENEGQANRLPLNTPFGSVLGAIAAQDATFWPDLVHQPPLTAFLVW
jgi:hypothetical protein